MITKPKSSDPKLKNFTAVVPVFVDLIIVVRKTQAENKQLDYRPIVVNNNKCRFVTDKYKNIPYDNNENEKRE